MLTGIHSVQSLWSIRETSFFIGRDSCIFLFTSMFPAIICRSLLSFILFFFFLVLRTCSSVSFIIKQTTIPESWIINIIYTESTCYTLCLLIGSYIYNAACSFTTKQYFSVLEKWFDSQTLNIFTFLG